MSNSLRARMEELKKLIIKSHWSDSPEDYDHCAAQLAPELIEAVEALEGALKDCVAECEFHGASNTTATNKGRAALALLDKETP